ncbi:MAG TPA: methyltransferase domain-containing protein, partial [bacterium]|nr:methyltransferase domain-containing protein [bacterium]
GDAVVPESVALLAGKGYLVEEVEGLKFKIPPFSFFQVNPRAVAGFYRVLRDLPLAADPGMVLDLFCGIGPISLLLAPRAREVVGVEMDGAAVETARENAVLNGAGNVEFIAGDARKVLYERRENWTGRFGLLVVNPPRSGIGKKVLKRIRELRPPFILYSSCNPRTFSEQAEGLFDDYRPVLGRPFDFFPHTPHQELLALFERRREEKP